MGGSVTYLLLDVLQLLLQLLYVVVRVSNPVVHQRTLRQSGVVVRAGRRDRLLDLLDDLGDVRIPPDGGRYRNHIVNLRPALDALLHYLRAGLARADVPARLEQNGRFLIGTHQALLDFDPGGDRLATDEAFLDQRSASRAAHDVAARLEQHVALQVRTDQALVQRGRVFLAARRVHVHLVALLVLVAFVERLAEVRIRAEVERRLSLFVLDRQIGAVRGQEAGDARGRFLIRALAAEAHQ